MLAAISAKTFNTYKIPALASAGFLANLVSQVKSSVRVAMDSMVLLLTAALRKPY